MEEFVTAEFKRRQEAFYRKDVVNDDRIASPGSQYVVQLIKGGYLEDHSDTVKKRVLDMGCGGGYNLVTFWMMGWEPYGCEISHGIVKNALKNLAMYGAKAKIAVGDNQHIPYGSGTFDFLLSANVIHYVSCHEGMNRTIREYARVLKSGGRLLVLTAHPDNWLVQGAQWTGPNIARIRNPMDFRDGEMFFIFKNESEIQTFFSQYFEDIKIGVNRIDLFKKKLVNYVISGVRRSERVERVLPESDRAA